jgi:hypothetical protein
LRGEIAPASVQTSGSRTVDNLPSLLSPIKIKLQLDDLLLDPNNPRLSEPGEGLNPIPEARGG